MSNPSGVADRAAAAETHDDDLPARQSTGEPAQFLNAPDSSGPDEKKTVLHSPELRKFVKFCIVGASSTVVTFTILNLCKYGLHFPLFTSVTIAFLLSVVNGFFWNRKWTFKHARNDSAHEQSMKFLAVNVVGYLLTTSIVVLIVAHFAIKGGLFADWAQLKAVLYNIISGEKKEYPPLLVNGAQAAAVCIVVWWNYFANRHWTFRH